MTTDTLAAAWCRSCGKDQTRSTGDCSACGTDLTAARHDDSRVGLVYELRGRMLVNKRPAICTRDDGTTATLLMGGGKGPTTLPVSQLPRASELVRPALSSAARLLSVGRSPDLARFGWDEEDLRAQAGAMLSGSLSARRQMAVEALQLGWPDIFDWLNLSASEKAWYRAHHAAAHGYLDQLMDAVVLLPSSGYVARARLLLPHLDRLAQAGEGWSPILEGWADAGVPHAAEALAVLGESWLDGTAAGTTMLRSLGEQSRADEWSEAVRRLADDQPPGLPVRDAAAWAALDAYGRGMRGECVDDEALSLSRVTTAMLDDLIDVAAVTSQVDTSRMPDESRIRVLARVAPEHLDDRDLTRASHWAELARRAFLDEDRSSLDRIPNEAPVRHYAAMLDVLNGGKPDPENLRPDALTKLELVDGCRAALTDGSLTLPPPLLADPTLWPLFVKEVRDGRVTVDVEVGERFPDFQRWADLQRLLGLIWEARWDDALTVGHRLIEQLSDEQQQDEALSLTAYVLSHLGDDLAALKLVERALEGSYTEALLVNASILAARTEPETAAKHFARLIQEAPNSELKTAALLKAIRVWVGHSGDFPQQLQRPLEEVLRSHTSVDDYVELMQVGVATNPAMVVGLHDPRDDRTPAYKIFRARARYREEPKYSLHDLAGEFITVYQEVGRPTWFDAEWKPLVDYVIDAVFTDFGKALGPATLIDRVNLAAPELFTPIQRFILVPQAGTHIAVHLAESEDQLNDQAAVKFFFRPVEEFLSMRQEFPPEVAHRLADNFSLTLAVAGIHYLGSSREGIAGPYNALVERLRWDRQNTYAIKQRMATILETATEAVAQCDRYLERMKRLPIEDADHSSRVRNLSEAVSEWRSEIINLRSHL
jgi:hypothetical protein